MFIVIANDIKLTNRQLTAVRDTDIKLALLQVSEDQLQQIFTMDVKLQSAN